MTMPNFDDPDVQIAAVQVDPSDPQNDQLAAQAKEDLAWHVQSTRNLLGQGPNDATAMAVMSITMGTNSDMYPHGRIAALLSAALIQLAHAEEQDADE